MKFITYNRTHYSRLWRFALVITAIAITLIATLWLDRDAPVANFFSPSVVLAAPSSQLPASFPSSAFNMSAYIDTGQPIDLDKITALYPTKRLIGSGYVVVEADSTILYASDDGWLVAGFEDNTWLSSLGKWSLPEGDLYSHSTSFESLANVVEAAITASGNGADASGISYYHWANPTATELIVFSRSTNGLPTTMTFTIPSSVTVLQASYNCTSNKNSGPQYSSTWPYFKLDGAELSISCNPNNRRWTGWSTPPAQSVEHTIKLEPSTSSHKLGIAVYLLIE
jgi:hypothetical protein